MEVIKILIVFVLIKSISVGYSAVGDNVLCERQSLSACNLEMVKLFRTQLAIRKKMILDRFGLTNQSRYSPSTFYSGGMIDQVLFQKSIDAYIYGVNSLRNCERSIGQNVTKCKMSAYQKRSLSDSLNENLAILELGVMNGNCAKRNVMNRTEIVNSSGKRLAYRLKYSWVLDREYQCRSDDTKSPNTTRSISLGGYDPKYGKGSYLMAHDWSEGSCSNRIIMEQFSCEKNGYEWFTYPVSAHVARKVKLGRKTLSYDATDKGLKFSWSNGANIIIDQNDGRIIESNILKSRSYNEIFCHTKTYIRNGRRRFKPNISLESDFLALPVVDVNG